MSWLPACVSAVKESNCLIVLAGAGLGADSGLPTFRDKEGFWRAYPPAAKAGKQFSECSNPKMFVQDARAAWGFFGQCVNCLICPPNELTCCVVDITSTKRPFLIADMKFFDDGQWRRSKGTLCLLQTWMDIS